MVKYIKLPLEELIMIEIDSKVTGVTVFNDRAEVNREVKVEIEKGEHILKFRDIPSVIDENSIKVDGKGEAIIKDVSIKKIFLLDSYQKNLKELYSQKESLVDNIEKLEKKSLRIEKEKSLIDSISHRITTLSQKENRNLDLELNMNRWIEMIDFYRGKLKVLDEEEYLLNKELKELNKELKKIKNQINNSGDIGQKYNYEVKVTVEAKESGEILLNLSYIVYSASWKPIYDVRVLSEEKRVNITYNATVTQNSAEDWSDVNIKLSTAKPSIGGSHPKLTAWHLHKVEPTPPISYNNQQNIRAVMPMKKAKNIYQKEECIVGMVEEPEFAKFDDFEIQEAQIDNKIASAIFSLTQNADIPSDNTPHKVTIMLQPFDAEFRYSIIPKLSQFAYLQAKIINSSDYPLIAGETNIYLDNSFVANSTIDTISSGEDFWVFLGVDEGVKVEYKRLKKFKEKVGIISKEDKITFEYLTTITNNKKSSINIQLQDQLPISNDKEIIVDLIEPKYEKESKELKIDNQKFIEWNFELKSKAKRDIEFKYSVRNPEDVMINLD